VTPAGKKIGSMAGASILDMAWRRMGRALASDAATDLFEVQGVAEGVYFAFARPQGGSQLQRRHLRELSVRGPT
jgi:hypothetical protein